MYCMTTRSSCAGDEEEQQHIKSPKIISTGRRHGSGSWRQPETEAGADPEEELPSFANLGPLIAAMEGMNNVGKL